MGRQITCKNVGTTLIQGYGHGQRAGIAAKCNAQHPPSGLPFTGLDLAFVVPGTIALLLVGAALRRVGRRA